MSNKLRAMVVGYVLLLFSQVGPSVSQSPAGTIIIRNNNHEIYKIDKNRTDRSPLHLNVTSNYHNNQYHPRKNRTKQQGTATTNNPISIVIDTKPTSYTQTYSLPQANESPASKTLQDPTQTYWFLCVARNT